MKKAKTYDKMLRVLDKHKMEDKLGKGYSDNNRMAKLTQYRGVIRRFKNDVRCPKSFHDEFQKSINIIAERNKLDSERIK